MSVWFSREAMDRGKTKIRVETPRSNTWLGDYFGASSEASLRGGFGGRTHGGLRKDGWMSSKARRRGLGRPSGVGA